MSYVEQNDSDSDLLVKFNFYTGDYITVLSTHLAHRKGVVFSIGFGGRVWAEVFIVFEKTMKSRNLFAEYV